MGCRRAGSTSSPGSKFRLRNRHSTEDDEQDVGEFLLTEDFRDAWESDDVVVAAATMMEMKQDQKRRTEEAHLDEDVAVRRDTYRLYVIDRSQSKPPIQDNGFIRLAAEILYV